jgi:hypothetical protein
MNKKFFIAAITVFAGIIIAAEIKKSRRPASIIEFVKNNKDTHDGPGFEWEKRNHKGPGFEWDKRQSCTAVDCVHTNDTTGGPVSAPCIWNY